MRSIDTSLCFWLSSQHCGTSTKTWRMSPDTIDDQQLNDVLMAEV